MTVGSEWRAVDALRLHPVAERLLARPDAGRLFPAPGGGPVRVLPDGTVVTGAGILLEAHRERRTRLTVEVVPEAAGEDPAVHDLAAVTDLLGGSRNPLALGAVYGELRRGWRHAGRPRKGYKVHKYLRQHGRKPHERLQELLKEALGYSPDQLAKFETVLRLPPVLQEAFSAGSVALRVLLDLAARPREEVVAVAAEVRAGVAPSEAVARRRTTAEPVPAARTCLRRLLRAVANADAGLAGRVAELSYLSDPDRTVLEHGRGLLDELLTLPSKGDLLAAMLGGRPTGPDE